MKAFLRLLRKDLEASKLPILINCVLLIGWLLLLRYRLAAKLPIEAVFALLVVPLTFLPLWFMWQSLRTLRSEWREDTIFSLLLLPVTGWQLISAKLVALVIEATVIVITYSGGILILFQNTIRSLLSDILTGISLTLLLKNGLLVYLGAVALFTSFLIFVQLAFIVAKLIGRFHGLVMIWVFILTTWLVDRMGYILQPVFAWIPDIPLDKLFGMNELLTVIKGENPAIVWQWNISAEVGAWLAVIGLFVLSGWLLENYMEVNE